MMVFSSYSEAWVCQQFLFSVSNWSGGWPIIQSKGKLACSIV